MSSAPVNPPLAPWRGFQERLAGYFAARASGLLASGFALSSRNGEEFGRLRIHGEEGAELEAGSTKATIERTARSRYRMLTGDALYPGAQRAGVEPCPFGSVHGHPAELPAVPVEQDELRRDEAPGSGRERATEGTLRSQPGSERRFGRRRFHGAPLYAGRPVEFRGRSG